MQNFETILIIERHGKKIAIMLKRGTELTLDNIDDVHMSDMPEKRSGAGV